MSVKCTKQLFRDWHFYPCQKAVTGEHEGKPYCSSHHPDKVNARHAKLQAKWKAENDAKWAKHAEQKKRVDAYPKLVALLVESQSRMSKEWIERRDVLLTELGE